MFETMTRMGSGAAGAYEIERSLRFNRDDSARLAWTPSSAGNRKTWTFSAWVKLGHTGTNSASDPGNGIIFNAGASGTGNNMALRITNDGYIGIDYYGVVGAYSTERLRDPSAWYHCVWRMDTTTGSTANHLRVYVNGLLVYNHSMSLSQNDDTPINNNVEHVIGAYSYDVTHAYRFDGYLADVYFIDGGGHPTDFGETDEDTGQWVPKKYSGSYGSNGFYLNFSDNSNTTSGTLGADSSGNSNDWTPSNLSVSAGVDNDSLVDTPTNNYCTLNRICGGSSTFSNGNLNTSMAAVNGCAVSNWAFDSGKWYAEYVITSIAGYAVMGIAAPHSKGWNVTQESNAQCVVWAHGTGTIYDLGDWTHASGTLSGHTFTTNDVIGLALNMDDKELTVYKNNTNCGTIGFTHSLDSVCFMMGMSHGSSAGAGYANFGQRPFNTSSTEPPTGYQAPCTANLPEPTIKRGDKHFSIKIYTGDGESSNPIAHGLDAAPDLWVGKTRGTSQDWIVSDTLRGVANYMNWNGTGGDAGYGTISWNNTAPDATNITVGENGGGWGTNQDGIEQVLYSWVGGGSGTSNSDGSITSSVSVNATAGFSIVSFEGTGANATVGHGLGVAPDFITIKNRENNSGIWVTYLKSNIAVTGAGHTEYLTLNDAYPSYDDNSAFNDTAPTSTVFSVGTSVAANESTKDIIAYCFSAVEGYSRVGIYPGTGLADGPFIYTGFRPAWVMLKRTDTNGYNWTIYDKLRIGYNQENHVLQPNEPHEEKTSGYGEIDILANGFKHRASGDANLASSKNVYLAFAETPFKYANAR